MLLLVFLIGFLASSPIGAQDENSEDAFEIRRDSQENEGLDTFVMSTAILEQETTTAPSRPSTTGGTTSAALEETMGEDPFEPASSPILPDPEMTSPEPKAITIALETTVEQAEETEPTGTSEQTTVSTKESTEASTEGSAPTVPTTVETTVGETTETNVELSTEVTSSSSTELEETVPTEADVWTTSTETAERRVLKEKSGEELAKKDPVEDTTATQVTLPHGDATDGNIESTVHIGEESTTKTSSEEEAPFDSSSLGGLFEADGSPKVDENSPTFPLASLPPHEQPEQSEEILEKERTEMVVESTTERASTVKEETTTVTPTTEKMEEKPVMMRPVAMTKTPITIKITSIEWMSDFADNSSGKFRKLSEQILPELNTLLKNELGDDFVSIQIDSFTKGSVVVNAVMNTKEPVGDPEQLATRLESTVSASGSLLAGNTVDPSSITVNGIPSRAYLNKVNQSYAPSTTSPLLIAAIIGVATVLLILVVILICLVNNRRSHGGMKMGLPSSVEDGPPRAFGVPQLNSMSYASSTRNTGSQPRPDEREVV